MKRRFKIFIFTLMLGMAFNVNAQSKVNKYSFSVYVSSGTASSECLDIKKAYVSPIVSHSFDKEYSWNTESETMNLGRKWSKKCQAKFGINKTYCWGSRQQVWRKSRSEVDEERDKVIADLRRQGYSITENYTFGFRYNYK
ncbi:hypothetical protein [Polaribacter sp.]|uniref:hypothetical protein n=1 Tax=Polaribacter sp. TaxID=1920175 RepID=UPI003F6C20C9